jgi:hypothetical protein
MNANRYLLGFAALAIALAFCSPAAAQVKGRNQTRKDGTHGKVNQRSNQGGTGQLGTTQTPQAGNGGRQFVNFAAGYYQGVPNYRMSACAQSRAMQYYASLLPSLAYNPQNSYADSLYSQSLDYLSSEAERRTALAQKRRDDEKERREKSRAAIPVKTFTNEELAQSKFTCAHNLWLGGNVEAARRWLERLVKEYPATETADRAKITLAKL